MPVIPYCVFLPTTALPEIVTGVLQAPTATIEESGLAALYSEIGVLPSDPGELAQAAMSFQSTVQQVFGAGMVIPFRFPTLLKDQDGLRVHLRDNAARYARSLQYLSGMAQMEIRLTRLGGGAPAAPAPSGMEYLKARQSASQSVDEARKALRDAAGELVREWLDRESSGVTRSYALIAHESAHEFKRRVGFVRLAGGVRAVISGPWPPSEFLSEEP